MVASVKELGSCPVIARDGRAGWLADILFDDRNWRVRWISIEIGPWLFGRPILIAPETVIGFDEKTWKLYVDLTRIELEQAPRAESLPPTPGQRACGADTLGASGEGWPGFLPQPYIVSPLSESDERAASFYQSRNSNDDANLGSAEELAGYEVFKSGRKLGRVLDLLLSDHLSSVEAMIVRAGPWWWPSRELLVNPRSIDEIDWVRRKIVVSQIQRAQKLVTPWRPPLKPLRRQSLSST